MTKNEIDTGILDDACDAGQEWFEGHRRKGYQWLWDHCPHGHWSMWFLEKVAKVSLPVLRECLQECLMLTSAFKGIDVTSWASESDNVAWTLWEPWIDAELSKGHAAIVREWFDLDGVLNDSYCEAVI